MIKLLALFIIMTIAVFLLADILYTQTLEQTGINSPLSIEILSSNTLDGIAGDYVNVQGQIKNKGQKPITDITTYLSLVDTENKLPVDLEDWSAEKGLYIGTIEPGQILPLNWKIHFVKAGDYSLIVVANISNTEMPQVSSIIHFKVNPKKSLNPGQVLPVALTTPIMLVFILFIINYRRQRHNL